MAKFSLDLVPQLLQDPYPFLREWREAEPVTYIEEFQIWLVTRYEQVESVLLDVDGNFSVQYRRFSFRPEDVPPDTEAGRRTVQALEHLLMHKDPPDHTRLRKLARAAFSRTSIHALRPRVERIVDELLDRAAQKGRIDLVADFSVPIPLIVMADFLGVPEEDAKDFQRWSDDALMRLDISKPPDVRAQALGGMVEMHAHFESLLAERARNPRNDIISALASVREDGHQLSADEAFATYVSLVLAGTETTRHLIGNSVVALQRHPDQRKLLLENMDLLPQAIEEILRYDGPITMTAARTPLEDMQFAGVTFRAGDRVIPSLGGANRDPRVFADPDRLDILRTSGTNERTGRIDHIAFGAGAHFCIGSALARLEAQCALKGLLTRFPDFVADVDGPLDYQPTLFIRGLSSLPVDLGR